MKDLIAGGTTLIAAEPMQGLNRSTAASWSNDGKRMAFHPWGPKNDFRYSQLLILEADDGKPSVRPLGMGNGPTYSPDDKRIAFFCWPGSGDDQVSVWVMDGPNRH